MSNSHNPYATLSDFSTTEPMLFRKRNDAQGEKSSFLRMIDKAHIKGNWLVSLSSHNDKNVTIDM